MTSWRELQERINSCPECKRVGSGLTLHCEQPPARPPAPPAGSVLFISEAPPPQGGFWTKPSVKDDLREKLIDILHVFLQEQNLSPSGMRIDENLEKFVSMGLFLIQTIKWPLCHSARNLRPAERKLIEHSIISHLVPELALIRPSAIVSLGKVACYACGCMFSECGFSFDQSQKLEAVRGKRFMVKMGDCPDIPVYPTGLPVRQQQRRNNLPRIVQEIKDVLRRHWHTDRKSFGEIIPGADGA